MARVKNRDFGAADGFDFSPDVSDEPEVKDNPVDNSVKKEKSSERPKKEEAPNVNGRTYSPYYKPHPKTGARGGVLGKPAVKEEDRKIQFSLSCTQAQKEQYIEAARNDGRKLPDFINNAIQEYIKNHGL